ncbi:MAG: hypothetical protein N2035_10670, partial [Chthoniobacterales bacterium]|nr:hypothetical protein [Chthoniobacterales bacterium]
MLEDIEPFIGHSIIFPAFLHGMTLSYKSILDKAKKKYKTLSCDKLYCKPDGVYSMKIVFITFLFALSCAGVMNTRDKSV